MNQNKSSSSSVVVVVLAEKEEGFGFVLFFCVVAPQDWHLRLRGSMVASQKGHFRTDLFREDAGGKGAEPPPFWNEEDGALYWLLNEVGGGWAAAAAAEFWGQLLAKWPWDVRRVSLFSCWCFEKIQTYQVDCIDSKQLKKSWRKKKNLDWGFVVDCFLWTWCKGKQVCS